MKRFVRFLAINVLVLFALQYVLGFLLDGVYKRSSIFKTNIIYSKSYGIASKDVLILGGSRGLTGLNSRFLADKTHKSMFNLATDDTQLPIHLMQLKMLVARGIKPKYILLDLLSTDGYSHNALRFMPLIGDPDVDAFFVKYNGGAWLTLQKVFPLYKYVYFNVELLYPSLLAARNRKYQYRSDENGDYCYPDVVGQIKKDSLSVMALAASPTFDSFSKICSDNGIKMVAIVEPFYKTAVTTGYGGVINFSTLYNDRPDLFFDAMHLNSRGRDAYNVVVADTLSKIFN